MIKICALNKDSEEETRSEEEVTKEALEQIALQQYAKALDLHRKGSVADATQLLKELLDTELLDGIKKLAPGERPTTPLFNLKYLCFKNLAAMLGAAGEVVAGIEAYRQAAELDDTDLTLWHRLGLLCLRARRYDAALSAFRRGVHLNPKHWPCLDKILMLLLGLDHMEDCVSLSYEALQLDPGYLRALVYRRHIFHNYPYVRSYMEYVSPMYKWDETVDEEIDEQAAEKLLAEAEQIQKTYLEQQKAERFQHILPILPLQKPILKLTWESVGESLVDMHHYMSENCFSHACYIDIIYDEEALCQETNETTKQGSKVTNDNQTVSDESDIANKENMSIDVTTTEIVEGDAQPVTPPPEEQAADILTETRKKNPTRRRGSALGFLQQWEWYYKRQPRRKKVASKQERLDDNIYDILRSMIPPSLTSDSDNTEDEENLNTPSENLETTVTVPVIEENMPYFGTETEQTDVQQFIKRHTESKHDIIDILKDYLSILARKWKVRWSASLSTTFMEANKCYNTHVDEPLSTSDQHDELIHYILVNLLVEELTVSEKFNSSDNDKQHHELRVIESIKMMIMLKKSIFEGSDFLEVMLRYLWLKLHINILNKNDELALDCLNKLSLEFEAMGDYSQSYHLDVCNFSFKPVINTTEIAAYIKFLERNTRLSSVLDLYKQGCYEEALSIVIDSFDHCRNLDRKQEDEMSLDFAAQLVVIIDAYWALEQLDNCFKWSLICLHEALKHYFRYTSGSKDYEKWTLTVVKILTCMEQVLTTEGFSCLESVSQKELGQGLEDLIRIIGHQVETNATEMPFGTIVPWIIMHFILQREEDQGRGRSANDSESVDEVPNPLMVLFVGHEQLGNRGWCCQSESKLMYFILDTVVPRLRSPALSKCLEQVCQYMEQCVYCLYGHPGKKNKVKYLADHNVLPRTLDWERAQQIYEIFRPTDLPALESKSGITADTEQLFHRILELLPAECDPQKYVPEVEKYIKGIENKLPCPSAPLPYRIKDIYFLLGDYYFKKEEQKMAIKYNIFDVIINSDRLESWAEISLAKAVNLHRLLNSCKNLNNEKEFLNPAKSIIRCFKRTLQLDPSYCNILIEYGMFVYTVHSFCSRLLKQASESLSMDDFESLEKQKEDMLDTTHKCFMTVLEDMKNCSETEKDNEDAWLHFYMLGKVAEKRNRLPAEYLNYYMQAVKSLQETNATYPAKINYCSPAHLSIEVLELHYRIHATILKYIEQHENKPIPSSVGKVFASCIEEWKNGPFANKKSKKETTSEQEIGTKVEEVVQAANIQKRSISDSVETSYPDAKKMKSEASAAKVKRSASYDTETRAKTNTISTIKENTEIKNQEAVKTLQSIEELHDDRKTETCGPDDTTRVRVEKNKSNGPKNSESSSSSSSSSSDSNSSESSSESSSDSSRHSGVPKAVDDKPLSDEDIMKIVSACLDALEDCASRFPPHYKAIYRLAHYHFYYKKGKDIERCRDLMLSTFKSRSGQKLGGLFNERKTSNFFNNIWKIPQDEVDRAGGFAFHMSRSVLLSMEILKEIDDHKTLLDLSLHLQRIPGADKKYLRDSDREELAQQALSLCLQSLKGQLLKFSQQGDLKSNEVEKKAFNSLMLDIYRYYQRTQKQPGAKQFTSLLVDAYKLVTTTPITENMNLVDLSMKYCQSLIQTLKQQATQASRERTQNAQKKQAVKVAPAVAPAPTPTAKASAPKAPAASTSQTSQKCEFKAPAAPTPAKMPDMAATAFQNFMPLMSDATTAAALSYLSNMSALAGYTQTLQNTLQSSMQNRLHNSFEAEFYRQLLTQSLSSYNLPPPAKKQKRAPRRPQVPKPPKTVASSAPASSKPPPPPAAAPGQKAAASLAPSMGTVLSTLPPSIASLSYGGPASSAQPAQAHTASASAAAATGAMHGQPPPPPPPPQQASPGKTLQEKLAERQKSGKPSPPAVAAPKPAKAAARRKHTDVNKTLPFGDRPSATGSDEIIVLDDD